jgi:hypothetical protein
MNSNELAPLAAAEINHEHELAMQAAESAMDHAVRCGELLIKQKKRLEYGEFEQWVLDNLSFSHDTANNYMRAARCPKNERARFSSLRQMINYHRDVKRAKKFISYGLEIHDIELQKKLGVPPGHDLQAWAAFREVGNLIAWFAGKVRGLDPLEIYRGSIPVDFEKLRPHLRSAIRFLNALRMIDRTVDFCGRLPTPEEMESLTVHGIAPDHVVRKGSNGEDVERAGEDRA